MTPAAPVSGSCERCKVKLTEDNCKLVRGHCDPCTVAIADEHIAEMTTILLTPENSYLFKTTDDSFIIKE